MKKSFLTLIAILTFVGSTFATNSLSIKDSEESVNISLTLNDKEINDEINLKFDSSADFKSFDTNQLNIIVTDYDDTCSVTATITVSHTVGGEAGIGIASVGGSTTPTVSASITASCDEIGAAIRSLRATLLAAIQE